MNSTTWLTAGRLCNAGATDDALVGLSLGAAGGVRRGLRRTAIKAGQQGTRDDPGLPGQESQRAKFTYKSGLWPKAWPPVPVATSSGFSPSVVLAESTRRATFVVS